MILTGIGYQALGKGKAAVLGHPISHSLSPALHGYWLKQHQIEGSYEAIETPVEALADTLKKLADENYRGVNLTVPLKESIIPLLDEIDPIAQKIGAVNTLVFENGKIKGYNTDAYGFLRNLESASQRVNASTAFIFGAGGAARAILAGLIEAGIKKTMICNRNKERAEELAESFMLVPLPQAGGVRGGCQATTAHPHPSPPPQAGEGVKDEGFTIKTCHWQDYPSHLPHHSLIINTTSLGMKNQPALEVDFSECHPTTLVTDIVYNPLETPFLKNAKVAHLQTIDGLGMLLYQGQKAFEHFFGILPEVTEDLRQEIVSRL
jgi:shikimate dehydrogenase